MGSVRIAIVPVYLKPPDLSLKHVARVAIRKHLIELNPHENLLGRIPQLDLFQHLYEYLLYEVSLEVADDYDEHCDYDYDNDEIDGDVMDD